jgi:tellurite resistance protein TerC
METIAGPWTWGLFTAGVLALLALDLGVFHRKAHEVRFKEALAWSVVWIGLAVAFNVWVGAQFGPQRGLEFTTGYLIEKALSVDNVFVFLVIFTTFGVPAHLQHRVLFWGVLGALVMRGIFIAGGAALMQSFHGVLYVFGAILLLTGIKLIVQRHHEEHPERLPVFRWLSRLIPSTPRYHGARFWVKEGGRWLATPLFMVLLLVEITDVVFAVDSVPAIFAVTDDPFIVYSSNVFAILGLRALYFCISGFVSRLVYLKVGLGLVLVFVAGKMLLADVYKVPIDVSLMVVGALLGGSVIASLARRPRAEAPDAEEGRRAS